MSGTDTQEDGPIGSRTMGVTGLGSSSGEDRRIAVWSGPRNISTALMRAWEARGDTCVSDEPLYAHYLLVTGAPHPGREEIVARCETDWRVVVERLAGVVPGGMRIHYQKHMAHHLLPEMYGRWLERLTHAFLIREPAEMIVSLSRVMEHPTLSDTGLPQQWNLYRYVTETLGQAAPVIDARDVLARPAVMLEKLCRTLEVPFTDAMLSWKPGLRPTDGIWAPYWYDRVAASTGFNPSVARDEPVPEELAGLLEACRPIYARLHSNRLIP